MPVQIDLRDSVAVLTLNRPPVNSFDLALRRDLRAALAMVMTKPEVQAVVLTGGPRHFSAGADIEEFAAGTRGGATAVPTLPDVIIDLDQAAKPVVAAIAGTCLGGGLEVALGCHHRVVAANATLGLPEVKLGILPGAGGTQRLPRAIGVKAALDMILSGAPVNGARAAKLGLATLSTGDLIEDAVAVARQAAKDGARPRLSLQRAEMPADAGADWFQRQIDGLKRPLPAPLACIEAVRAAVELPFSQGLQKEFNLFRELVVTPESKALQYAFFAERRAARIDGLSPDVQPRTIERVAVIGAGTMGAGIATVAVNAGLEVILLDRDEASVQKGLAGITKGYDAAVAKGRMDAAERDRRLGRLRTATDLAACAAVDLVIEAAFEDMGVKQDIFRALDKVCGPDAILASNTSTLDLDAIAAITSRPQSVVGLHFFSPAPVMRLLEVVRGAETAPEVLATAMALSRKLGKVGVVAGVCNGFIGNRMVEEYLRQAYFLVDEGVLPWQVDGALERWGMAMGPFAMMDLAGNDIGRAIRAGRKALGDERAYSTFPDKICALGRFGQKTGKGYYQYDPTTRARETDPEVDALAQAHAKEVAQKFGLSPRVIGDEEIVARCLLALANEGAALLGEGIAQRASDIDVVYLNGYGFPAHKGGPMFHADSLGLENVLRLMEGFLDGYQGQFWKPAPLLWEKASAGGRLTA
ncbi:3-hydroxyacyl-CoA dehydrogenase NAD-binding domain-containing protein [Nitrospirillum sp. BR 11163]|uniref:3-hydroxyacyl-CoA dehydrogenase NAD-binding domain-containing protein n=1 Tax=Nitrospirillum sp. BR 11163 TaxID=3104323 RepID=UPI002AFE1DA2|nr:3-hydroxyacyl-CoA dehydrogenase NAD-binding domain-containing protein [Nitrospirillum sp. BR 11163]MEA1674867.1 3-hydroxyacyl-CoA dehydrogenase NAD-binding domain-containing protein [Nitrospirillum sp. BR 11163]